MNPAFEAAAEFVDGVIRKHQTASLAPLLDSCRLLAKADVLNVGIFGRFKAGKSSFLNHFVGRPVLPTGVIPVTTVVTEMGFGPDSVAEIQYLDGHCESVSPGEIGAFVAEKENPHNSKSVSIVRVKLPDLAEYRGLRFVDTPGLESVLAHNTETSLTWAPNVALALVGISVDQPLSKQDLALIGMLYRHTPEVVLLLTKADLLNERDFAEVENFMKRELKREIGKVPRLFPYSVRAGYEHLKQQLDVDVFQPYLARLGEERQTILQHKWSILLAECEGYLKLALSAASKLESERDDMKAAILGEKSALDEVKREMRVLANDSARQTFNAVMEVVGKMKPETDRLVLDLFDAEVTNWSRLNLLQLTETYENWIRGTLSETLNALSTRCQNAFVSSLDNVKDRLARPLRRFREDLAKRVEDLLGIRLQLSDVEIDIAPPRLPTVRIGQTFEHHFELLWFLTPMSVFRSMIERRLRRKIPYEVFKNLSRLGSQWSDQLNQAILQAERQTERRLEDFVSTVEHLLLQTDAESGHILQELEYLRRIRFDLLR